MLNELENKIRKAIPELNELKEYEVDYDRINRYGTHQFNRGGLNLDLVKFEDWLEIKKVEKPIQLNHVLEYVFNSRTYKGAKIGADDELILHITSKWNLKSNLVSDQSEELIKFINELK